MARKKGGQKGSKAKKAPVSKYKYRDARMQYHLGNFSKAASILRQAAISPEEKEEARQLEISIHQHIAYEQFSKSQYQEVIDTLSLQIKGKEHQQESWIIKAHIFMGLSSMYLGKFKDAKTHLKSVLFSEEMTSFSFYYLLAELYEHHLDYPTEAAFLEIHTDFVRHIDTSQKNYLQIIFYILKNDVEKAAAQINLFEGHSRTQKINIDAVSAILNNTRFKTTTAVDKVKPLYRLLLNLPINTEEKAYLSTFEPLEKALKKQEVIKTAINLEKVLSQLCEQGQPIPTKNWVETLQQIPEQYKTYVIYNQVAALVQDDLEKNIEDINRIIKTSPSFFDLPESLLLYYRAVYYHVEKHSFSIVWKNTTDFIRHHADLLTPGQLNLIGWKLADILLVFEQRQYINFLKDIIQLTEKYDLIGIKLWLMLRYSAEETSNIPTEADDIFTSKEIQNHQRAFLDALTDFTQSLEIEKGLFSKLGNMFGLSTKDMKDGEYEHNGLYRLQQQFFKAVALDNVHPSAKETIFAVYKVLHQENSKALKHSQNKIAETNYSSLKENYLKSLIRFEENHPESPYYKDYRALLLMKSNETIVNILLDRWNKTKEKQLKALVKSDENIENIIEVMFDLIDKYHFHDNLILSLSHFFKILGREDAEKAKEYGRKFVEKYKKICDANYHCEHPVEFFLNFLETSLETFDKTLFPIFYQMAQIYPLPLTDDKSPLQYKVIGLLLEYTMEMLEKHPQHLTNDDFNQALLDYLGDKIKRDKRLKKLKTLHEKASNFFKKSK